MPKAILFDVDGTLWDRNSAVRALLLDQHDEFRDRLADVQPHTYVDRIMALEANGSADKLAVYVAFGEECGLSESLIESHPDEHWTDVEIAQELGVTERTIRTYRARVVRFVKDHL